MGCFNETCAVTGVAIKSDDPVVGMWMSGDKPLPFFWTGNYNDYGWFADIQCEPAMQKAMFTYLRERICALPEKSRVDTAIDPSTLDWDSLREFSHRGRLFARAASYQGRGIYEDDDPAGEYEKEIDRLIAEKDELVANGGDLTTIDDKISAIAGVRQSTMLHVRHVFVHRRAWDRIADMRVNPNWRDPKDTEPYNWDKMYYQLEELVEKRDASDNDDFFFMLGIEDGSKFLDEFRSYAASSLDYHAAWSGLLYDSIREMVMDRSNSFEDLAAQLEPFMRSRWFLHILSSMGKRMVIPNSCGQSDNRSMAMQYAAIVMDMATRPDGYRGVNIED